MWLAPPCSSPPRTPPSLPARCSPSTAVSRGVDAAPRRWSPAAGATGRACARLFGATHDLILTDAPPRLDAFARGLKGEGYAVPLSLVGDLGDGAVVSALVAAVCRGQAPTLIHTAGLPPAPGDWRAIMTVNLVATVRLLDTLEPVLRPGSGRY